MSMTGDSSFATKRSVGSSTPIDCICSREHGHRAVSTSLKADENMNSMNKLLVPHFRDPEDVIAKDE